MRPPDAPRRTIPRLTSRPAAIVAIAILVGGFLLIGGRAAIEDDLGSPEHVQAVGSTTTTTIVSASTTTPVTSTIGSTRPPQETLPGATPPIGARYVVPPTEAEPEAKQLAVDIAHELTTYEPSDDHTARLAALASLSGVELLTEASAPLTYVGSRSRGEVVYPQLGGLTDDRASVMVVTRQTVGSDAGAEFSVVRTLDIRLSRGETGWEFDYLSSAGGSFDDLGDLTLAHAVAADPRIEMPDSARLDILSGLVSPTLLDVMADLAEQTSYGVIVLATGHPHNVFETDRQSHHTVGQAVDIYRVGDRLVIDDRLEGSPTHAITGWLYDHPDVLQVGSPWDLDGGQSRRSFTNAVHQDHIHLAVDV